MSLLPHLEPECTEHKGPSVDLEIEGRTRALVDGVTVRRLLPAVARRMVGPFVFFDHMGPVAMDAGRGVDVSPHPHIGLATVTYLFTGEMLHRDSLGSEQPIRPGAVNWMTAGRGIVHSERSPADERKSGVRLHGLQLWVALPAADEEMAPTFQHHAAGDIPIVDMNGTQLRVVAGSAFGATSPVAVRSPLFYVDARLSPGTTLPLPEDHAQRALYVVDGGVTCDGKSYGEGAMVVFREGVVACVTAPSAARVMLLGGAALDGERHIWWNFVSSSRERIVDAQRAWKERRFPVVPGDEHDFIPAPEMIGRPR